MKYTIQKIREMDFYRAAARSKILGWQLIERHCKRRLRDSIHKGQIIIGVAAEYIKVQIIIGVTAATRVPTAMWKVLFSKITWWKFILSFSIFALFFKDTSCDLDLVFFNRYFLKVHLSIIHWELDFTN